MNLKVDPILYHDWFQTHRVCNVWRCKGGEICNELRQSERLRPGHGGQDLQQELLTNSKRYGDQETSRQSQDHNSHGVVWNEVSLFLMHEAYICNHSFYPMLFYRSALTGTLTDKRPVILLKSPSPSMCQVEAVLSPTSQPVETEGSVDLHSNMYQDFSPRHYIRI